MPDPLPERLGHVRIEALLGFGGMGAVYLGFDERLERRVALKMMRSDWRSSPDAKARFMREARILSRLDHPNICRIHDLVQEPGAEALVLEYLEGRTLAELRPGELSYDERLRIGESLASALTAAHAQGIVHRDLKPDNVMLTTSGVVKVLDFGVGRLPGPPRPKPAGGQAAPEAGDAPPASADVRQTAGLDTNTVAGTLVGTPTYMSPEQARGEDVTPAADLFALGLLLQELLTGKPARVAASVPAMFEKVRDGRSEPAAGLDPDLAALIEALKSQEPARRPAAQEVAARLAFVRARPDRLRRRRTRIAAGAALALLLASTAAATFWLTRPRPLVEEGQRARLVVLPFANATDDKSLDWVEAGLMHLVAEGLAAQPDLDVVPVSQALPLAREQGLPGSGPLPPARVSGLTRALGGNLVLQTEVRRSPAGFALLYRLYRRDGSAVVKSVEAGDLPRAAELLTRGLALRVSPATRSVELRDRLSEDAWANQAYAMGLDRVDRSGARAAGAYFEACLDRDSGFLWAKLRLGSALRQLGEVEAGEARLREVREAAVERGDRRLEVEALRALGTSAYDSGDFARARELLTAALERGREQGDPYASLELLNNLASNAYREGQLDEAQRLWHRALTESRVLGYRKREGGVLNNLGAVAYARGQPDLARQLWTQALAVLRETESRSVIPQILTNLAVIESAAGRLDRAEAYEREALGIQREAGNKQGEGTVLFNLSETTYARGDTPSALSLATEGLAAARAAQDRFLEVHLLAGLAEFAGDAGDLVAAREHASAALALAPQLEGPEARCLAEAAAASVRLRDGRWHEARAHLDAARRLDPESATLLVLEARLAMAQKRPGEAARLLERARSGAHAWGPRWERELDAARTAAGSPASPSPPPGR